MSDRERWIIYPLLFAALSFGVRHHYVKPQEVDYRKIECNELTVKSYRDQPRVTLSATNNTGMIIIHAANDQPVVRLKSSSLQGLVEAMDSSGKSVASISATGDGGVVRLLGKGAKPTILLGHDQDLRMAGLVAVDDRDDLLQNSASDDGNNNWGLPLPAQAEQASDDEPNKGEPDNGEPNKGEPAKDEKGKADESEADSDGTIDSTAENGD